MVSHPVALEWNSRMCTSNKFPDGVANAQLGPQFENPGLSKNGNSQSKKDELRSDHGVSMAG